MRLFSVTEVIAPWNDFSKIPPATLQHAADRGTEVHDLCTKIAKGEFAVPSEESRPYVESFQKWFDMMVEEVILSEKRLVHEGWGYSGQLDLLCRLKDKRVFLADLKTPIALQKSWQVQLAGYRELCLAAGYQVDCVGSLRLSPDGKMAKVDFYLDSALDFNIFISALQVGRYLKS